MNWKWPVAAVVVGGSLAFVTLNGWAKSRVQDAWSGIVGKEGGGKKAAGAVEEGAAKKEAARRPWDGTIDVVQDQRESLGIELVEAQAQSRPMTLEIGGRTAYDPETQTHVRPKFLSRVDKVHVRLGEHVAKNAPLVDLFSSDLAETKATYEERLAQWERDQRQLQRSKELFSKGAMAEKDYLEDVNDERKSHQEYMSVRDKLEVLYGLTEAQIAAIKKQSGAARAKLTLHSPIDGYIIERNVVPDNIYDINSVLLVIAPLDKFWVWGNIYPSDANMVRVGQTWQVDCSFLGRTLPCKVEVVTPQVDPETKTVRIGTRIDNYEGRVKADMLVSGRLEIPPDPGSTSIPRVALVTSDGGSYVFVQQPDHPDRFERRKVQVSREGHDRVILLTGLKPGEKVAARGSLLLAQIYEDAAMAESGAAL